MSDYIFQVKTVQTSVFKTLIEALKDILTDGNIDLGAGNSQNEDESEKGTIKIVALDPTQTVMVHLKLEGKYFEEYYCEKRTIIGVSMINLYKLIRTMTNNDILTLYITREDPNKLGIKIENSDKNQVTHYKLNLMDLTHSEVNIPPQSFDNVITMLSSDFQKICRDMSNLSDTIEITNVKNKLEFSCEGEFANQKTVLTEHIGLQFERQSDGFDIIQGFYNLKHLVLFTKCTNLSQNVQMFLKNDYPLIIQYTVGSLGFLKLALAPQVKENNI